MKPRKFLIFRENGTNIKRFLIFSKKLLKFEEVTCRARKIKKTLSQKVSYISGNGTF